MAAAPAQLSVVDREDGLTQVALSGSLDVFGVHDVDVPFHAHTAASRRPAIIDLTALEFINSLGIGMLIACAVSLRRHGAVMVLVNPTEQVRRVLVTGRVDEVIPIVGDLAGAEELLKKQKAARAGTRA